MSNVLPAILGLGGTILVYMLTRKLYERYPNPFTLPILLSTTSIVIVLLFFKIPYESYQIGAQWIEKLLGPAVVALAYPLYKQWKLVSTYAVPIIVGVVVGACIGITSGFYFALWLGVENEIIYSVLPKSVTTPVAMEVSGDIGGVPSLAAIFVMIAGIGGTVLSPFCYKLFRIHHEVARGIGLGSASHAVGTAKAIEYSQQEGAISTVAMTLSAIVVSIIIPILVILIK
ncbi:LrgB family protein [Bacillus alkalicellulosilyticus]|uniref:LrgB family protein n=1 Tax=Alkalihalobacterium alkalicellulosilyticum TaxID=1912214 RepID=UPI0009984088|nr:LrgB family protein [Bacillus alkalicellulosilyticus]